MGAGMSEEVVESRCIVANLDARDLNRLALHWQAQSAGWCGGDFTADGVVNAQDLNGLALNSHRYVSVAPPVIAALPLLLNVREPRVPLQVRKVVVQA